LIYPASIKSYRYQNGSDFFFSASAGSVLVLEGPLVLKSFSYCLLRPSASVSRASIQFFDGDSQIFKTGLTTYLGFYPSYDSVSIPGAGIRIKKSLRVGIEDADSNQDAQCHNLNIGYQR